SWGRCTPEEDDVGAGLARSAALCDALACSPALCDALACSAPDRAARASGPAPSWPQVRSGYSLRNSTIRKPSAAIGVAIRNTVATEEATACATPSRTAGGRVWIVPGLACRTVGLRCPRRCRGTLRGSQ